MDAPRLAVGYQREPGTHEDRALRVVLSCVHLRPRCAATLRRAVVVPDEPLARSWLDAAVVRQDVVHMAVDNVRLMDRLADRACVLERVVLPEIAMRVRVAPSGECGRV